MCNYPLTSIASAGEPSAEVLLALAGWPLGQRGGRAGERRSLDTPPASPHALHRWLPRPPGPDDCSSWPSQRSSGLPPGWPSAFSSALLC